MLILICQILNPSYKHLLLEVIDIDEELAAELDLALGDDDDDEDEDKDENEEEDSEDEDEDAQARKLSSEQIRDLVNCSREKRGMKLPAQGFPYQSTLENLTRYIYRCSSRNLYALRMPLTHYCGLGMKLA